MDQKLNYFAAIGFLSKYMARYKQNFIMFYFGWFFDTMLFVAMPISSGIMIDEIVYYQNLNAFLKMSVVFVVMLVFSCVLYFFIYAQYHYLMNMYALDIKRNLFGHLQKCDAQYMADASSGDIITILQFYLSEFMHFIIRNVIHLFNNMLIVVVIVAYLFVINWRIGLFILFVAPVSVIINTRFGKKIRSYGDRQRECYGGYISRVFEYLSGIRDIRIMGVVDKTGKAFEENHREMFAVNVKSGIAVMTADNLIGLVNLLTQFAIFTFAGYLAMSGDITMGATDYRHLFFYAHVQD